GADAHGNDAEKAEERKARDGGTEEKRVDAVISDVVVRGGIHRIDRVVVTDQGGDRRHIVDRLDLHVEAGRERIALAGVGQLRQTGDALRALESLRLVDVGQSGDARVVL